jgi:hypothetical protein
VLLQKQILGIESLPSPYKLIAADVNRSGTISTFDLVSMRKVILEISNEFPDNTSWRFIPANYQFPDPTDPFASPFPEYISTDSLFTNFSQNFIAIKVGDLNNSVNIGQFVATEGRTADVMLSATDEPLTAGTTQRIALHVPQGVQGFQFTLDYDENQLDMETLSANLPGWDASNFYHVADQGIVNVSWNHPQGTALDAANEAVIWLDVQAKTSGISLSEALQLNTNYLASEAYLDHTQASTLALNFAPLVEQTIASTLELHQNFPNPFAEQTSIRFQLPEAGPARLVVADALGRVLYSMQQEFEQGTNEVQINSAQLAAASGTLYYRLETGREVQTRQMVLIR